MEEITITFPMDMYEKMVKAQEIVANRLESIEGGGSVYFDEKEVKDIMESFM